jgi:hypothetical protein
MTITRTTTRTRILTVSFYEGCAATPEHSLKHDGMIDDGKSKTGYSGVLYLYLKAMNQISGHYNCHPILIAEIDARV